MQPFFQEYHEALVSRVFKEQPIFMMNIKKNKSRFLHQCALNFVAVNQCMMCMKMSM